MSEMMCTIVHGNPECFLVRQKMDMEVTLSGITVGTSSTYWLLGGHPYTGRWFVELFRRSGQGL